MYDFAHLHGCFLSVILLLCRIQVQSHHQRLFILAWHKIRVTHYRYYRGKVADFQGHQLHGVINAALDTLKVSNLTFSLCYFKILKLRMHVQCCLVHIMFMVSLLTVSFPCSSHSRAEAQSTAPAPSQVSATRSTTCLWPP